jgi:hypothetical protein
VTGKSSLKRIAGMYSRRVVGLYDRKEWQDNSMWWEKGQDYMVQ